MIAELAAHLWQSTLFLGAAWLLSLALRKNAARVRYWVWFTAAVKFLIPFSLLIGLGTLAPRHKTAPPKRAAWMAAAEHMGQPFAAFPAAAVRAVTAHRSRGNYFAAAALSLWACGFAAVAIGWTVRWRRLHVLRISASKRMGRQFAVPVMSAPGLNEPGVFGLFRPVLLLPEFIEERLDGAQLDAILAHELCHVRRRDNLTAAIHMVPQAIFWFHPLVWWLGARLVDERERACDEEVLRLGCQPRVYAEGILNVCKLYVESPLACVSGVTGSNLKIRIEAIVKGPQALPLTLARKVALTAAGGAALAAPIVFGVLNTPSVRAGSSAPAAQAAASPAAPVQKTTPQQGTPRTISVAPVTASAQAAGDASPRFEVASVKPSPPPGPDDSRLVGCHGGPGSTDPGLFICTNADISFLITGAFHLTEYQYPARAYADGAMYEISAKVPPGTTREQFDRMWQNLLIDRFKLAYHYDKKEMAVYDLVIAKGGIKMKESPAQTVAPADAGPADGADAAAWRKPVLGADGFPTVPPPSPGHISMAMMDGRARWATINTTMEDLARMLSLEADYQVTDNTGLKGKYDFTLSWVFGSDGFQGPTLSEAVEQELGLKMERKRGQVDVFIVDHWERTPTPN